jgi:hypothetical protein
MTEIQDRAKIVQPFTYVALGVSVVVAAGWWFLIVGQQSSLYVDLFGEYLIQNVVILGLSAVVAIVVDVVAGRRGGIDRRFSIIAGVILVSPLVGIIVSSLIYSIPGVG